MPRPSAYPIWSSFAPRRDSGLPFQEQLVRFFRDAVARGALRGGTRVPATRVLAQELGLSRNTVGLAYERLVAEGFFEARHGSGTFVSERLPARPAAPSRPRDAQAPAGSRRAAALLATPRPAPAAPDWPLVPGLPALDAFPCALWARLEARFWRRHPVATLAYGDPRGYLPLREALAGYLGAARGITCTADHIVVTPGTQAGVLIAALAVSDPGERAWVEHPGHEATRRSLALAGLQVIGVPVDGEGLDVEAGRARAPEARLALVSPSHQYPLGTVMSLARRLSLLQWAAGCDAFVIEDDYDSEFRYGGAPVSTLKALDGGGRVLYVGTLSKMLAPGLRLGFLVVPDRLVDAVQAVRLAVDRHVPAPLQAVTAAFIADGHLGAHIRRLRAIYAERRDALIAAGEAAGPGRIELDRCATGLHMVAYLPPGLSDAAVAAEARARRIGVVPLSGYAVPDAPPLPRQGLMMGFGNTPPRQIRAAVAAVRDCVGRHQAGSPAADRRLSRAAPR